MFGCRPSTPFFIIRRDSCLNMLQAGIIAMAAHWDDEELQGLQADFPDMLGVYDSNASKHNPRPGVWSCMSIFPSDLSIWVPDRSMLVNDSCCLIFLLFCRYRQNRVPACCSQQLPFLLGRRKVYAYHAIGRRAVVWLVVAL